MNKSGIDDEAIQSGENLLLTFTDIRNEVGKGNDIFNQATTDRLHPTCPVATRAGHEDRARSSSGRR